MEEISFSRTTGTATSRSVLEEVKKAASVKMRKVQLPFRQDRTDRPNGLCDGLEIFNNRWDGVTLTYHNSTLEKQCC